ncbi:MAG: endonuclease III [Gemmatimonadota bacterium]
MAGSPHTTAAVAKQTPGAAGRAATRRPTGARDRAATIGPTLAKLYPGLEISLTYSNPLELLVATILSAQCTDERVNRVTPALFLRYPEAADYAESDPDELEQLIHSTGFFRNKAKNIRGMAQRLVAQHEGQVPDSMDTLVALPGVARKTANVVLSNAFEKYEGVVVDTHVKRLSNRLRLTKHADPLKVEQDLMAILPRDEWRPFSWRLIQHGRARCTAQKPDCAGCELADSCPSAGSFD